MDIKKTLITDYDWPFSYVYVPWPVDSLSRQSLSPEQIQEIEKNIIEAKKLRNR